MLLSCKAELTIVLGNVDFVVSGYFESQFKLNNAFYNATTKSKVHTQTFDC